MKHWFVIVSIIIIMSCTKDTSTNAYNDIPVVESYLQSGEIPSVKISHTVATGNVKYGWLIDTIQVKLKINDSVFILKRNDSGYFVDSSLVIRSGQRYDLEFNYNGHTATAYTIIPSKPVSFKESAYTISVSKVSISNGVPSGGFTAPPDPIKLTWDNTDGSYYVVTVENIETSPELVFDTSGSVKPPSNVFRNKPTKTNTYSIQSQQFSYFGKHRIILHHINPDYATLYDDNSNSSQSLKTPSTGILNGVGIFTGIHDDTLYLKVNKQ
jgi:hypothetical protein